MTVTTQLLKKSKESPESMTEDEAIAVAQYKIRLEQCRTNTKTKADDAITETSVSFATTLTSLAELPPYVPEDENDNVLICGRWLERGCAAFVVSTAGTGKSIFAMQCAIMWSHGLPFCGLRPRRRLRVWMIQSEDSETRLAIDLADITAHLKEQYETVDWNAVAAQVKILKIPAKVGSEWLDALDAILQSVRNETPDEAPDVLIINPFIAYIGGPVTNGEYVTPFLRGGEINRRHTCGIQDILERNGIGALILHHTPKPPSGRELGDWLKSPFPEYQGAGSSDITNWGRSFITMMRPPSNRRVVILTAGKNGAGLKWPEIDGGYRRCMRWSDSESIDGGARHAWCEMTEEDARAEIKSAACGNAENGGSERKAETPEEIARVIAAYVKAKGAMNATELSDYCDNQIPRRKWREAERLFKTSPQSFGCRKDYGYNDRNQQVAVYSVCSENGNIDEAERTFAEESETLDNIHF